MPSYVPAKKNTAFITYVGLPSHDNALILQADPTIAAADVLVAIDDGDPAQLSTTPEVDANFTKRVKVSLTAAEMNGDNITVIFSDVSGDEWCDLLINIQTADRQINDLPTTTEFEARTILSDDYTIVSDLGVVQTGDSYAIVNGESGLVSIQADIDEILIDTAEIETIGDNVDDILADTDELQTDWTNDGRLDSILDDVLLDTGTTIPGRLDTLDTNVFNLVTALITSFAPSTISAVIGNGLTLGQYMGLKK